MNEVVHPVDVLSFAFAQAPAVRVRLIPCGCVPIDLLGRTFHLLRRAEKGAGVVRHPNRLGWRCRRRRSRLTRRRRGRAAVCGADRGGGEEPDAGGEKDPADRADLWRGFRAAGSGCRVPLPGRPFEPALRVAARPSLAGLRRVIHRAIVAAAPGTMAIARAPR